MPRKVTRKAPSLLAVTIFLYVLFAETVTVTRSLGQKPVPRTTTGERDVIVMWAAVTDAPAVGSNTNTSARKRANLSLEQESEPHAGAVPAPANCQPPAMYAASPSSGSQGLCPGSRLRYRGRARLRAETAHTRPPGSRSRGG